MKKNWKLQEVKKILFPELKSATNQALLLRNIDRISKKEEFLKPDYNRDITNPFLLKGMNEAVKRILKAKDKDEKICIYGDYDADGVTATVLLDDFFSQIKIKHFCYIPDKEKEGNGLNQKAIDKVIAQGAKLIITVDCGISNWQEIDYASKNQIEIIITDHHSLPRKIPQAVAIVNPKMTDKYPQKDLAGVGVAFKLAQGIASKIKNYDEEQLKWLLDLVAIGTIADCVPLLKENRTLVKFGLLVLAKTRRVGLKQIFQVSSLKIDNHSIPTSEQISFYLAPRINAAGRMEHAKLAFKLLSLNDRDMVQARILALELEEKNRARQKVTQEIIKEVEKRLKKQKDIPPIIIEWDPHWNYGIVGLVAGRIADKYQRPALILQEKKDVLRGSGRSVAQINLIAIFREQDNLLEKYGGHAFALGGEIKKSNIDELKKKLSIRLKPLLSKNEQKIIKIDSHLNLTDIDNQLLDELEQLEPFGEKNREPIFFSDKLLIKDIRQVGNGEKHLKMVFENITGDKTLSAIGFGLGKEFPDLTVGKQVEIIYNLQKNTWNGQTNPQAKLIDLEVIN